MATIQPQLFIGDLDSKVREADLYNFLKQFGDIFRIRLRSYGEYSYALVTYKESEIARRVQKDLNGTEFMGKRMRVSKFMRERFDYVADVFVKNIPEHLTPREFGDLFSNFGVVLSSKVCFDETGKSLGYGFVQYEKMEHAEAAIAGMNSKLLQGNELTVQAFVPFKNRIGSISTSGNLYVRGFPVSYTEQDLLTAFSQYGRVVSTAVIVYNGRASGFVCYERPDEARIACEHQNNKEDGDFTWYVMPHMSKIHRKKVLREQYLMQVEEWKKKNLYIKNLDRSIDESKLSDICKEYGPIKSLKICKMENIKYDGEGNCVKESISKEIAYVHFESERSASIALSELQKKLIEGKKLFVAKWKPRDTLRKMINSTKIQKPFKFAALQGPRLMNPRSFPRAPMMPRSNMVPFANYPQMIPRGRVPRAMGFQPPAHIPQVDQRKPTVLRPDIIDQYTTRDLGEKLYPMVLKYTNPSIVGKITGMLLEMEKGEVVNLINDESSLQNRVREAVGVLRQAWMNNPEALQTLPS